MDYKIVKEKVETANDADTYWCLMEYREGVNEPWTCIADDKNRDRLARYKENLERGAL